MTISVDFTDVESNEYEPIPEGRYQATVFDVEQKPSKSSDFPYLNWQFKIQGGDYDGRRVFMMTSLKPNALWKLKDVLDEIAPEIDTSGKLDLDLTELMGLNCRVEVIQEEYKGDMKNRVDDVFAPAEEDDLDVPF